MKPILPVYLRLFEQADVCLMNKRGRLKRVIGTLERELPSCHGTQFAPQGSDRVPTRLTASTFFQLIESRDARLGALTGVAYAEGIVVREPLLRASLFDDRGDR